MATSVDPSHGSFPNFQGDGIMGMGFKKTSASGADSFFTTLIALGGPTFGDPVFGLSLADPSPALIIGGRDTSKVSGDFTFFNLTSKVSILRGVPRLALRLTRTRYRLLGRSRWILSQSTEKSLSPLGMQFLTRATSLSQVTYRLSLTSITISPIRSRI